MASFPNVDLAAPCSATAERASLLASSFTCAALSIAAVDDAVVAHLELATLQRNGLTSTVPRTAGVLA